MPVAIQPSPMIVLLLFVAMKNDKKRGIKAAADDEDKPSAAPQLSHSRTRPNGRKAFFQAENALFSQEGHLVTRHLPIHITLR